MENNKMNYLNSTIKRIHCIGIGGIGLSGLAELLQKKGFELSGSDVHCSDVTDRLSKLGVRIDQGHKAEYVKSADLVVYSSAVSNENPEIKAAKSSNIPLVLRGVLLAELIQDYFSIAVAGTHGKTTTTGFIAQLFETAKLDPSYAIGGKIRDHETSVRLGESRYFIAEADESDQSFLYMHPNIAVITNIEADHLENYGSDFEQLKASFLQFIESMPQDGLVILGIDCPVARSLLSKITRRVVTFGFSEEADFRAVHCYYDGMHSHVTVRRPNTASLSLNLQVPGKHNVLNAIASVVLANELGLSDDVLVKGLERFPGMGRRFHPHGEIILPSGKALLFEDYGHHPSAIAATLSMAKQAWPDQRIVMVFQPHRYSRTRDLMDDFARVLHSADVLVLLDVYAASEIPDEKGSAKALYEVLLQQNLKPVFIPEFDQVSKRLHAILHSNDIVILQGAGSVGSLAEAIKERG